MADDLEERLAKRARSDRSGWQGASLELERKNPEESSRTAAAVDLEQFRNHQVGVGYQAKHVVRQPGAPPKSKSSDPQTTKRTEKEDEPSPKEEEEQEDRLSKYLNHPGLRRLRKELEIYK